MQARAPAAACVVSPNPADAELALTVLAEHGIEASAVASLREAAYTLGPAVGCVIAVEEALLAEDIPAFREALGRLPPWCDLPLILISRNVAALGVAAGAAFPTSGNVTLLERPLNAHTLVSSVQVALRATAHQREVGELLEEREQAVHLRDEFLAMLAHELRNPLAPMRNALYLMRSMPPDDPEVEKTSEILERQVNHLVRIVEDLMDVARLERGKVALKKERLDLNDVVAAAVDTCRAAAHARGHRIDLYLSEDAVPIDADAVRIEQIVCNLVNNAIKFSPEPGEIRVETAAQDGFAALAVKDRGIGFDPGVAATLFDPFLQVNPTLERSSGGLGVGLTIVRRLAELHGGSAEAASAGAGRGARFVVRLPLAPVDAAAPAEGAAEQAPARPRRVVVIDDNPDIRESLRLLFTLWGHVVSLAPDGPSGLDLVLKERPDVALVDVGLPGMNGYDLARAVRRALPAEEIRLVALTGYGQPDDIDRALQAGFNTHLLKPIDPKVLARTLGE